jgi:hypothetical protein
MATELKNSLDWQKLHLELQVQLATVKNPRVLKDARRMLTNFDPMIAKLSNLELKSRRTAGHPMRSVQEQLDYINTEVNNFEQWLLIAMLSS